uniref:Uncharacterized protein MANES_17G019600 n=1 Tax=Rhizophora mucronata TaxID=61149 RepID=A0A2P2KH72_RHIMU
MACRGCLACLLNLLNFLLTLVGLAMVGYGIYLLVEYMRAYGDMPVPPVSYDPGLIQLGRPMLMAVSLSERIFDKLPAAWFIYLFIGVGVILFVISCVGCIGTVTRNGCCLRFYSVLIILLILVELGCAAFIFFDKRWKQVSFYSPLHIFPDPSPSDSDLRLLIQRLAKFFLLGNSI